MAKYIGIDMLVFRLHQNKWCVGEWPETETGLRTSKIIGAKNSDMLQPDTAASTIA